MPGEPHGQRTGKATVPAVAESQTQLSTGVPSTQSIKAKKQKFKAVNIVRVYKV